MGPRPAMLVALCALAAPLLAGCAAPGDDAPAVDAPPWRVGDSWTYLRTAPTGAETIHERTVTSTYLHGAHMVYELRSGIRNHPLQDYHLYTTDDLRFVGSDLRDGSTLLKRLTVQEPFIFHYVFPLEPGSHIEEEGTLRQTTGPHGQTDPVHVSATVAPARDLTLGERVYRVVPYEIRIEYLATPFEGASVLRGHWSAAVGQSVLTELTEGGATTRHELVYFDRVEPTPGPPAYRMVAPLESRPLARGFRGELDDGGWARYLFHVEDPVRVRVDVQVPDDDIPPEVSRLDLVSLRPVGYTQAGIVERLEEIATAGLLLHVAAVHNGQPAVVRHAAQGLANDEVHLAPGQVYELILASNLGQVAVDVEHGDERQDFAPAERGRASVLSVQHERVREETLPGPQHVEDALEADLRATPGEKIEGIVYAVNHGAEGSVGEVSADRSVHLNLNGWPFTAPDSLYAYYFGFVPPDGFQARAGFQYRADLALQGMADYEVGVFLLRLL